MDLELREKLSVLAVRYNKTGDLSTYVQNGNGMYVDEKDCLIKFNHTLDEPTALKIVGEIQEILSEYGYSSKYCGDCQLPGSRIVKEYTIAYIEKRDDAEQ